MSINSKTVATCRQKLLAKKAELINQARHAKTEMRLYGEEQGHGDEIDRSANLLSEHALLSQQERVRFQLFEIEQALGRIEVGTFGLCEETDEPIETERLLAIPWTRLSIEGAELREEMNKRFAR